MTKEECQPDKDQKKEAKDLTEKGGRFRACSARNTVGEKNRQSKEMRKRGAQTLPGQIEKGQDMTMQIRLKRLLLFLRTQTRSQ
ncbi:hypothetical protein DPMN_186626 [Dreissena polymorpha]|uniref:Uncharacterized protein n=1 Tax=Dreissena polymorpha TaxID=45954 RepID=A0A9D4I9I5_DREPO|nr:hypothetical protein DPMN_186626 [Dreissena polymorpha]